MVYTIRSTAPTLLRTWVAPVLWLRRWPSSGKGDLSRHSACAPGTALTSERRPWTFVAIVSALASADKRLFTSYGAGDRHWVRMFGDASRHSAFRHTKRNLTKLQRWLPCTMAFTMLVLFHWRRIGHCSAGARSRPSPASRHISHVESRLHTPMIVCRAQEMYDSTAPGLSGQR